MHRRCASDEDEHTITIGGNELGRKADPDTEQTNNAHSAIPRPLHRTAEPRHSTSSGQRNGRRLPAHDQTQHVVEASTQYNLSTKRVENILDVYAFFRDGRDNGDHYGKRKRYDVWRNRAELFVWRLQFHCKMSDRYRRPESTKGRRPRCTAQIFD